MIENQNIKTERSDLHVQCRGQNSIQWVIDNTDKIENIGENAYKIYEKNRTHS